MSQVATTALMEGLKVREVLWLGGRGVGTCSGRRRSERSPRRSYCLRFGRKQSDIFEGTGKFDLHS